MTVFIIEDDENIRELVIYALKSKGFDAFGFLSYNEFNNFILDSKKYPDLILLDVMLPEMDGITILKKLRANSKFDKIGIIMLTAKDSEIDKVTGLDSGAEDYITKPFGIIELLSRINAVLRRVNNNNDNQNAQILTYKNIKLDKLTHTVLVDGITVSLTLKEFDTLYCLMLNLNKVLSRDKLLDNVWGYEFAGESRTVDMHIKTLRQKLLTAGNLIKTIRGVGYKLGE